MSQRPSISKSPTTRSRRQQANKTPGVPHGRKRNSRAVLKNSPRVPAPQRQAIPQASPVAAASRTSPKSTLVTLTHMPEARELPPPNPVMASPSHVFTSIQNQIQDIRTDLSFVKFMLCSLHNFPLQPGMPPEEQAVKQRLIEARLIFETPAVQSRFLTHIFFAEIGSSVLPPHFFTSTENCPSLVISALLFSREGNVSVTDAKSSPSGKRHYYLKKAVVGTAFLNMGKDRIIRWNDSAKRHAWRDDEDKVLRSMSARSKHTFVLRNSFISALDKPRWISVSSKNLQKACTMGETTATERRLKRQRSEEEPREDVDHVDGEEFRQVDEFQVSVVRTYINGTTSFLNKSRRYVKTESLKAGMFILHQKLDARVEGGISSFDSQEVIAHDDLQAMIPETKKAFGTSDEAFSTYADNDLRFAELVRMRPEMRMYVSYKVTVDGREHRAFEDISILRMTMTIVTALLQCSEQELLVLFPSCLRSIYKVAVCIRQLFMRALNGEHTYESNFPKVAAGFLQLQSLLPRDEMVKTYITKRTNLTAAQFESFAPLALGSSHTGDTNSLHAPILGMEDEITEDRSLGIVAIDL